MKKHYTRYYQRFYGDYTDEYDNLEQAIERAESDNEYGQAYTEKIVDNNSGKIVWAGPFHQFLLEKTKDVGGANGSI